MSTANKLTYLNTTKGKIKDSINLTGAGITNNDTFRSYSAKLRDGLVDVINDGGKTLYNNFPKVTGTGSSATLNNTYQAPMKVDLSGNTHQDSYSGKNLLNIYGILQTNNADTFEILDDDWCHYVNSSGNAEEVKFADIQIEPNTSYSILVETKDITGTPFIVWNERNSSSSIKTIYPNTSQIITTNGNTSILRMSITTSNTNTIGNYKIRIMIVKSTTIDTDYEPYTGVTPSPNPDYPQDIEVVTGYNEVEVVGRNLFDSINLAPKYSTSNTSAITIENGKQIKYTGSNSSTGAYLCSYVITKLNDYVGKTVRLKANFTASASNKGRYALGLSNSGGSNRIQQAYTTTSGEIINFQVPTLNNEQTYLYVSLYANHSGTLAQNNYVNYTNIILTIDDEDMNYEPYHSQSYEVNLGKNLFDISTTPFITRVAYNSSGVQQDWSNYSGTTTKIKVQPNTTYTLSEDRNAYTTQIVEYNSGGTFVTRQLLSNYGKTFTTGNNTYLINISISDETIPTQVQLEEGTQATPYSAYKTPIEMCKIPNTDYKDEIRRSTGKNLFDKDNANELNGYIQASTAKIIAGDGSDKIIYINCKPNTTYAIQKIMNTPYNRNRFRIGTSSSIPQNNTILDNFYRYDSETVEGDNPTTITYTTNSSAKYLVIYVWTTNGNYTYQQILDTIQIEEGTQATDLEPYGVGVWYKYDKIGKRQFDGTEAWETNGENTNYGQYIYNVANKMNGTLNILCNKFINESGAEGNYIYGRPSNNRTSITIAKSICAYNLSTFKTWLSNNNVVAYYVLATPTVTTLDTELQTQLEDIYNNAKSYLGQTNITAEYVSGNQPFIMDVSALLKEE